MILIWLGMGALGTKLLLLGADGGGALPIVLGGALLILFAATVEIL